MAVDLSVFSKLKTKADFDREAELWALNKAQKLAEMQKSKIADNPSNVKEWQYYNSLPMEDQKRYLQMKRADQIMNLGGEMAVRNPLGGVQESYQVTPKITETPDYQANIEASKKQAEMMAEDSTKAQLGLGKAEQQAQDALRLIEDIKKSRGFSAVVGKPNIFKGQIPYLGAIPGSSASDTQSMINQLKGKNFLQAFESLKGGGAITEREGIAAENAIARMDQSQSEDAFKKALEDLQQVINNGLARAKSKSKTLPNVFGPNNPALSSAMPPTLPNQDYIDDIGVQQKIRLKYNPATGEFE